MPLAPWLSGARLAALSFGAVSGFPCPSLWGRCPSGFPARTGPASLSRRVHRGESDTRHKAYRFRTMHRSAQQTGRWDVVCCYCSPFRAGSPEATTTTGGTGKTRMSKNRRRFLRGLFTVAALPVPEDTSSIARHAMRRRATAGATMRPPTTQSTLQWDPIWGSPFSIGPDFSKQLCYTCVPAIHNAGGPHANPSVSDPQ